MRRIINYLFKKRVVKPKDEKTTSYDTSRDETSTPQKVREGDEPEAIRQRLEKAKGN